MFVTTRMLSRSKIDDATAQAAAEAAYAVKAKHRQGGLGQKTSPAPSPARAGTCKSPDRERSRERRDMLAVMAVVVMLAMRVGGCVACHEEIAAASNTDRLEITHSRPFVRLDFTHNPGGPNFHVPVQRSAICILYWKQKICSGEKPPADAGPPGVPGGRSQTRAGVGQEPLEQRVWPSAGCHEHDTRVIVALAEIKAREPAVVTNRSLSRLTCPRRERKRRGRSPCRLW